MSGISFTGIGSGLQVSDIVNGLVNAEKQPYQQRVLKQQGELTTNISAVGSLKGALESIQSSLEKLSDAENYQLRTASGSDSKISLSAEKNAEVGNYDVHVDNLAQAHKSMTNSFTANEAVGEGKLTFSTAKQVADGETGFSIDVSSTDTLAEVRDKINDSKDNKSVIATIITEDDGSQRLVMTAKETGKDNEINITATQSDGSPLPGGNRLDDFSTANLTTLDAAKDAQITIDGAITVTSATNTFKDVIEGITITAQEVHEAGEDSKVSVSENNSMIETELKGFIDAYNKYIDLSNTLGKADGEGEDGALVGDSLLRSVTSKLRGGMTNSFAAGEGQELALSQLGVTTDRYGKLSLDSEELNKVLDTNPDSVQAFFIGDESNPGFAASTTDMLKSYTESQGILDSRIDGYNSQIERIEKDAERFDAKMASYEQRLLAQYNQMDLVVANMNSTSSYLMNQLNNMPGVVRQES